MGGDTKSKEEPPHGNPTASQPAPHRRRTLDPLPERVTIALGALRETAREGLLALSVGLGLAMVGEIFEEEIAQVVGPRGKPVALPGRATGTAASAGS